jgi:serine protein kinase
MEDNQRVTELLGKAILSLSEWKELVMQRPKLIRSAPQYVKDALEFYGMEQQMRFGRRDLNLKALQLSDKLDERLIGHGHIQARLYEILTTLCRDNTKMILLVGPNGSAKSTLWNAVSYALEAYSKTPEGARYLIEWVFPHDEDQGKKVGFSQALEDFDEDFTFAFMDDEKLDKIIDDAACSPAWLYEAEARRKYFGTNKYVLDNHLSPQAWKILQEIINVYKTKKKVRTEYSPDEVLKLAERHIRIRRTYISKTYQEGLAVMDPGTNPVYMAQKQKSPYGFGRRNTPYLLKNIEVPELAGPLSKAANGLMIMEDSLEGILQFVSQFFNDKRKLNIDGERYTLDLMLAGSINPEKLNLLKQDPEYNRFRTRLEIINVPYLLDYRLETQIYKAKFDDLRAYYHIAPHTEDLFALFCVMCRLEPIMSNPHYGAYEEAPELVALKDKLTKFTLLDKAKMYALGKLPEEVASRYHLSSDEQNTINRHIELIYNEHSDREGRTYNFSYREVDAIIDRAMLDAPSGFLSPISLMQKLEDVIQVERADYPFLRDADSDAAELLQLLDQEYFQIINLEMRDVFRFDYEGQIVQQIESYLVTGLKTLYIDKTAIRDQGGNDVTQRFLRDREMLIFGKGLSDGERQNFWFEWSAKVQAGVPPTQNIRTIFESHIYQARDRMYQEKRTEIQRKLDAMLLSLEGSKLGHLSPEEAQEVQENLQTLLSKGYNEQSAHELLGYLKSNLDRLVAL